MIEFERAPQDFGENASHLEISSYIPEHSPIVTIQLLEDDNHSLEAFENRREWQHNKHAGKMHVVFGCGDARNSLTSPKKSYGLLSIAAVGEAEPFVQVMEYEGVEDVAVVAHFDGEDTTIESMQNEGLPGCGGLGEKLKMLKDGAPANLEGVSGYVHNRVKHPDPIIQSSLTAQEITHLINKPALAAVQDHRTGKLHIVGCYWRQNGMFLSAVNNDLEFSDINPANYDPSKLYAKGIPSINPDALPDVFSNFREYAYENQKMVDEMKRNYPDIKDRLKVQNPHTMLLTTQLQPAKLRYPATLDEPGSYFKLTIARSKDRHNNFREISEKDLRDSLDQTEYPITHAVKNHGDKSQPFSKIGTFLIETGDIDLSLSLAKSAMRRSWMKEWADFEEHHIIAAEVKGGLATQFLEVT